MAPQIVADVEHLGPLDDDDKRALLAKLVDIAAGRARDLDQELGAASAATADSGRLLSQARAHKALVLVQTASEAVLAGSYLVAEQGKSVPLTIPGGEVVTVGHMAGSKVAKVLVIMPYAKFPKLRDAVAYERQVGDFVTSERANHFNSLPDAQRQEIAQRIAEIQNKRSWEPADREFVERWIGPRAWIDPHTALAIIRH